MTKNSEKQRHRDLNAALVGEQIHGPYWLRAHRDWRFWAVVMVMLVAMVVYVITNDLAWRPHGLGTPVLGVVAN